MPHNLDLVPAGVVLCDVVGRMTYLNKTMLEWLSADSAEAYIGRPIYTLLSPAGRIYFETHLRPMLMIEGRCSEISLELIATPEIRHRIYLNGSVEQDGEGQVVALHFVCFEGADRYRYEQELLLRRRKAEEYEAIVAASPDAIVTVDLDLRILSWNNAAEQLLGYAAEEALGQTLHPLTIFDEHLPETHDQIAVATNGTPITVETTRKHKDGSAIPVEASMSRTRDEHGTSTGFVNILRDITKRKRNEQTIHALNREVLHRSKNLLAVVGGIATMTARHTEPEDFNSVFKQRLTSLGDSMALLVERNWKTVELETLITQQLAHLGSDAMTRIDITGPVIDIDRDKAEPLGMAIFELSTNALKYGALSKPGGRISIHWANRGDAENSLSLSWREAGHTSVTAPSRQGFGSLLTGRMLETALSATVTAEFAPQGLSWRCDFEL